MSYEPLLAPEAQEQVYGLHRYTARITFGTNAISTVQPGKDLTIARTGTGVFTVTFPKTYTDWLQGSFMWTRASGANFQVVCTTDALSTTGVLTFTIYADGTSTATDPSNGDILRLVLAVSTDTLNSKF